MEIILIIFEPIGRMCDCVIRIFLKVMIILASILMLPLMMLEIVLPNRRIPRMPIVLRESRSPINYYKKQTSNWQKNGF